MEKGTNSTHLIGGVPSTLEQSVQEILTMVPGGRKGRAPSMDPFFGDSIDIMFDDWLPSLERAAVYNSWTEEESTRRQFRNWQKYWTLGVDH